MHPHLQESKTIKRKKPTRPTRHNLSSPKPKPTPESELEESFLALTRLYELPPPTLQHIFHPSRQWRFDFSWPIAKVAVEIQGVSSSQHPVTGPMHNSLNSLSRDYEKHNSALLLGWRILYFLGKDLKDNNIPSTINFVRTLLLPFYPSLSNDNQPNQPNRHSTNSTHSADHSPRGTWSSAVEAARRRLNPPTNP